MTETFTQPQAQRADSPRTNDVSRMLMPQLKEMAQSLGMSGVSGMRKSDLVAAIRARQSGQTQRSSAPEVAAAPAAVAGELPVVEPNGSGTVQSRQPQEGSYMTDQPTRTEAPVPAPVPQDDRASDHGSAATVLTPQQGAAGPSGAAEALGGHQAAAVRQPSARAGQPADGAAGPHEEAAQAQAGQRHDAAQPAAAEAAQDVQAQAGLPTESAPAAAAGQRSAESSEGGQVPNGEGGGQDRAGQAQDAPAARGRSGEQAPAGQPGDRNEEGGDRSERGRRRNRDRSRNRDRNANRDNANRDNANRDNANREGRSNERGNRNEPQIAEDDVLIPVAGILDLMDSYAFVRTSGYLPGQNDIYVSMSMVKRNRLRKGDAVTGAIKQPDENAAGGGGGRREKYTPLARLDTVNGAPPEQMLDRPEFGSLTPLYPQQRLRLETDANNLTTRIIDLVAPIGKGQRGLIVSPPKAGKTMVLQAIANAITLNNPECHLMVVLVDERPEEVTDMQRSVKGEVIASTFDRPADDHTTVAELAIERAKRLVELGHDVVVLLDSMTRLGRAYNLSAPASGRILSGGVDSAALYPPKKFFGAARNIENGGSLTILATALVETGSKMDEVIFEEFKGTGNMELKLDRRLADKRLFPAVDVDASGTRKEELLMAPEELKIVWKLRRVLHALDSLQAIELLTSKLKETSRNYDFLLQVQKTTATNERLD